LNVLFSHGSLFALLQVMLIDIVLAGDNAVVIGMAAARVPQIVRRKVVFWGLVAAVAARIFLAIFTVKLLETGPWLLFAGGLLLLWVCWKLWRDIREAAAEKKNSIDTLGAIAEKMGGPYSAEASTRMVRKAIVKIALADLSMSLDNVLAVAGAAQKHYVVLAAGLILSIGLMGLAASVIARVLNRHPWISYAGLFIVLYVAINMAWRGGMQIMPHVAG
jgi:YjbE family integral membrane protein